MIVSCRESCCVFIVEIQYRLQIFNPSSINSYARSTSFSVALYSRQEPCECESTELLFSFVKNSQAVEE